MYGVSDSSCTGYFAPLTTALESWMSETRGAGNYSYQTTATAVTLASTQNAARFNYHAAAAKRLLLIEPARTNIVPNPNFVDVAPNNNVPDGWTTAFGAAGVNFQCVGAGPHGGTVYRNIDSSGHFQLVAVPGASGIACSVWVKRITAAGAFSVLSVDVPPGSPTIALGSATHDWQRFTSQETTVGAGAAVYFLYRQAGSDDVWLALPQAEVGTYASTFVEGARAAELCAVDASVVGASSGFLSFLWSPMWAHNTFATVASLFEWAPNWRLDYNGGTDTFDVVVNGTVRATSAAQTFASGQLFKLSVRYGAGGTQLTVDKAGSGAAQYTNATAWGSPALAPYLGSRAASANCESAHYGDLLLAA